MMLGFNIAHSTVPRDEAAELVSRFLAARNSKRMAKHPMKVAIWTQAEEAAREAMASVGIQVIESTS